MKKRTLTGLMVAAAACLALLSGCTALTFNVSFDRVDGLKQKDPVLFKGTTVGRVADVVYNKDGRFLVAIEIPEQFSHAATVDSQFFVGDAPQDRQGKVIRIEQAKPGGDRIAAGTTIDGSIKETRRLSSAGGAAANPAESIFTVLEKSLSDLMKNFENLPETEEFQDLKGKLSDLEERLKTSGEKIGDTIRKDILPMLEEKLGHLAEEFRKQGLGDKADSLEQDMNRLKEY